MADVQSDIERVPGSPDPVLDTTPLLHSAKRVSQPWWRIPKARKLIPYVLLVSLARGISLSPKVDVFTHLACSAVKHEQTVFNPDIPIFFTTSTPSNVPNSYLPNTHPTSSTWKLFERNPLPATGPSRFCLTDPKVQAAAANLQTLLNTTVGLISALTSGYLSALGDRWGRKWIAWLVVFGFMFQDLVFLFCTVYGTQFHLRQYTLIVGAVVEGLLGSWAAFNATNNAYISDCSSANSRAKKFATFYGLFYAGVSLGPAIGSLSLRLLGLPTVGLFYIGIVSNLLVLLYIPMLLPESRTKEAMQASALEHAPSSQTAVVPASSRSRSAPNQRGKSGSSIFGFLRPLKLLGPRRNELGEGSSKTSAWDIDVTLLAIACFCGFLSNGIIPNKYLYAEHMFEWDTSQLGYYISIIASCRALWLIAALPLILKHHKPSTLTEASSPNSHPLVPLLPAIQFDLLVARLSAFVDMASFILVCFARSSGAFMALSTLSSFGGGLLSVSQSAMLILASRGSGEVSTGSMLGALSMLQALGQNIIGPVIFGFVYANTVAFLPQAIFMTAAILLGTAFVALLFVAPHQKIPAHLRPKSYPSKPVSHKSSLTSTGRPRRKRGRSRTSKDLRRPRPSFDTSEASSLFDDSRSTSSSSYYQQLDDDGRV